MSKLLLKTSSAILLIGISLFSFSAKAMDRLQQDAEFNQALGRGNPIPLNYPQYARGGGQVHQQNHLQRDLDINQRGGNPIPLNYPQHARGGGQVHHIVPNPIYNDDHYDDGFLEDYPDTRSKKEKQYDEDVYDYGQRNYPKSNTFKGEYTSSDSDS